MAHYAVIVPDIPKYPHTGVFREVAETVHFGLTALGHDSVLSSEPTDDRRSIVFGAQFLHPDSRLDSETIFYNLEQVGTPQTESFTLFQRHSLWDYSDHNVARWRERSVKAAHVPIGYVPELTRIEKAESPDIDVIFFGAASARRKRVIEALRAVGLCVHAFDSVYGAERDELVGRSKVLLNVGFYDEHRVFEIVRVSYALANAMCVVSEDGWGDEPFREGAAIRKYDDLVDACVELVANDRKREAQARRGLETMQSMPETEILQRVLS